MQECDCDGGSMWEAVDISDHSLTEAQIKVAIAPAGVVSCGVNCLTVTGQTIFIRGELNLDHTSIQFINCTLYVDKGGVIYTSGQPSNAHMILFDHCQISGYCDFMWQGIKVGTEGDIWMVNSDLSDAQYGIEINRKIHLTSLGSTYHSNYVTLYAHPIAPGNLNVIGTGIIEANDFDGGPLLVPGRYNGQLPLPQANKTFAAFELHNVTPYNFTSDATRLSRNPSANPNIFHDLNIGILAYESYLSVNNCVFEDIQRIPQYTSSAAQNGTAIYAYAKSIFPYTNPKNILIGNFNTATENYQNYFNRTYRSIYTVGNLNSTIIKNTITDNSFIAIQNDGSTNRTVNINWNDISNTGYGIWHNLSPSSQAIIEHNNISTRRDQLRYRFGIKVSDVAGSACNAQVLNNYIENYSTLGIIGQNNKGSTYSTNTVIMYQTQRLDLTDDIFGIRMEACRFNTLDCNLVNPDFYDIGRNMRCYSFATSPLTTIKCNYSGYGRIGYQFVGSCDQSSFYGNSMTNNDDGILLGDYGTGITGDFGNQLLYPPPSYTNTPGNTWWGNFNHAHTYTINLFTNPPTLLMNSYSPYQPINNLFSAGGNPINVIDPGGYDPYECSSCGDGGGGGGGEIIVGESIATNQSVPVGIDEELIKWDREKELFSRILQDSSLIDSSIILENFADTVQLTNKGKFAEILLDMEKIKFDGNNPPLTEINSVEGKNNSISTLAVFEETQKSVNTIILNTVFKDRWEFAQSEISILTDIANQCPYTHGQSVFSARALISFIDNEAQFDDQSICNNSTVLRKKRSYSDKGSNNEIGRIEIFPNPATSFITISGIAIGIKNLEFRMINTLSEVVMSMHLNSIDDIKNIELIGIPSGLYIIQVSDGENEYSSKLSIVH
jgi:hypothetical protein